MSDRRHKIRHVVGAFCDNIWAIDESKLDAMIAFLNLRAAGEELSAEEIQIRIGAATTPERPAVQISGGIAVLPLQGVLAARMNQMVQISGGTSMQLFGQQFQAVLDNPEVRGIVIDVDSPGGTVAGAQELADIIHVARGRKPVKAVASNQMASGAYYVGSAADEIVASPSSLLGSIGVVAVQAEHSRAYDRNGTTITVFRAGARKADGNPYEPLSSEARSSIQQRIDDAYQAFVGNVARNRRISAQVVEQNYGQGQQFYAQRALASGMVDRIATLEAVVREMASGISRNTGTRSNAGRATHSAVNPRQEETPAVWDQIKTALVARGFCSATASEAEVKAALNVFLSARGQTFTDEAAGLAAVNAAPLPAPTPVVTPAATPTATVTPPVVTPAAPTQADRDAITTAERERIRQIQVRGQLLGVDAQAIQGAIDSGISVEKALMQFTERQAPSQQPLGRPNVSVDGSPIDRIHIGAVEALAARYANQSVRRRNAGVDPKPLSAEARPFERMRLGQVAVATLNARGFRTDGMDAEDIAVAFMQLAGRDLVPMVATGGSYNTPGSYPNLLSALANKIMDDSVDYAEATWRLWCREVDPVNDFKPRTFVAMGASGELPYHRDGDDFDQSAVAEEASWLAVDSYGDEFKMTPVMMAGDDLGGFGEMAEDKSIASELTTNRLAVNLLTGNPTLSDTIAAFHANHGNLVDTGSGGAPSVAQSSIMRKQMRKQLAPGGLRRLRVGPSIVLVPTDLETVSEQTFLPNLIVPVTDATVNPFRGKLQVAVEPMLDDVSALEWYMFADPMRVRTIVVAFMQGYQSGGKRRTYFKNENQCQIFQIESRVGAAWRNFRGAQKNAGA